MAGTGRLRDRVGFLSQSLLIDAALSDSPPLGQAPEAESSSVRPSLQRSGVPKARSRKPPEKPGHSGNFIYEIISSIQARSAELCARYGSPGDCLEEAEVCLTMRDNDDNQIRLCLNTVPGENAAEEGKVQKSRLRR
jgi:hypothetical protein